MNYRVRSGSICLAAVLGCALLAGCDKGRNATSQPADPGVVKSTERGPVKLAIRADRSRLSIAEKLNLTIEATAEEGVELQMPSFGEKLNDFEIMDFRERTAIPVDAERSSAARKRSWTQTYVLESFLSGDLEIPAIAVKFTDRRAADAPKEGELVSEPFKIQVASLLAGEFDPRKFRDIKGTVDLPVDAGRAWLWWSLGGCCGAILLAVALWLLLRRKRRAAVPKPLAPHEWAFFALQRLEEDRLIESGHVQEFYFRLSGIVREYIERRFGLMAPERTTPEFLLEVRSAPSLSVDQKRLLGDFLQAADMVKFARYEPAASEVNGALETARAFVDQTTPGASTAPAEAVPASDDDVPRAASREVRA